MDSIISDGDEDIGIVYLNKLCSIHDSPRGIGIWIFHLLLFEKRSFHVLWVFYPGCIPYFLRIGPKLSLHLEFHQFAAFRIQNIHHIGHRCFEHYYSKCFILDRISYQKIDSHMKAPIIIYLSLVGGVLIYAIVDKFLTLKNFRLITRESIFKAVDRLLIYISIFGILTTLLWDFNYLRFSTSIPHEQWESITLRDFKGLRKPKENLDGEVYYAFVSTGIQVKKRKDKIKVVSQFHPCRSFVYNRDLFAEKLLTHEMYHFHITEYFARLIRKEIANSLSDQQAIHVRSIKQKHLEQERELQFQYDDETYHGYIYGKQLEWQEKIDSLLFSLDDYSAQTLSLQILQSKTQ
ncbi:MAG: hypothetical protein ABFS32_15265 [Bacteroidota bacterium]